jgi:hypothetical protein
LLPAISEKLRSAALVEARGFLNDIRFQVDRTPCDLFIQQLKYNPIVFDKLLEGWSERKSFDKWRECGMPDGDKYIEKPKIPFFLWGDSDPEIKDVRQLYNAEKNCIKISIRAFYNWISEHYPILEDCYRGVYKYSLARDMIEYFRFKLDIKSNEK